jgi:hypothetical protein
MLQQQSSRWKCQRALFMVSPQRTALAPSRNPRVPSAAQERRAAMGMEREECPCVQPDCNNGRRENWVVLVKGALCSCKQASNRQKQSSAAQASHGDHQY